MKACRNCRNWSGIEEYLDRDDPGAINAKVQWGACQRYAPRPHAIEIETGKAPPRIESHWPLVESDKSCGEWEPTFDS